MPRPLPPSRPVSSTASSACMCASGEACTSYEPGHALHLIQTRLASATPSSWRDGVVLAASPATGLVTVVDLNGAVGDWFNAAGAADAVAVGEPVAVHERYHVLSIGRQRFNVRPVA